MPELEPATVVRRLNRFTVEVEKDGARLPAHVANSGRIRELLAPGGPALLRRASNAKRVTAYDLVLVQVDGGWVSADATLPNALVREAIEAGGIPALRDYPDVRPEVRLDEGRIDFVLTGATGRCVVEVKSVTLVEDGWGLFPDAPSARASRHVGALRRAVEAGDAACVIFVVQRGDVEALRPCDEVDPAFGRVLREAVDAGVRVLAYRCAVSPQAVELADEIPVRL